MYWHKLQTATPHDPLASVVWAVGGCWRFWSLHILFFHRFCIYMIYIWLCPPTCSPICPSVSNPFLILRNSEVLWQLEQYKEWVEKSFGGTTLKLLYASFGITKFCINRSHISKLKITQVSMNLNQPKPSIRKLWSCTSTLFFDSPYIPSY